MKMKINENVRIVRRKAFDKIIDVLDKFKNSNERERIDIFWKYEEEMTEVYGKYLLTMLLNGPVVCIKTKFNKWIAICCRDVTYYYYEGLIKKAEELGLSETAKEFKMEYSELQKKLEDILEEASKEAD